MNGSDTTSRMPRRATCALTAAALIGVAIQAPAAQAQSAPAFEPRTFEVETAGDGPAMILIPGLASPGRVWEPTVAAFGDRYQTHVLTLAGFAGKAPVEATPFLETVAVELADYIRANDLDRPLIVGHSLGGFLALALASAEPELTGPVVVVDALPYLPAVWMPGATPETMRAQAEAMRQGMAAQTPEQFRASQQASVATMITDSATTRKVVSWTSRSDPATVAQAMFELFTVDLRPRLPQIQVPVLVYGSWVTYGAREQIRANYEREYTGLEGVQIQLSDHGRHFLMYDDPEGLHAAMRVWLDGQAYPRDSLSADH